MESHQLTRASRKSTWMHLTSVAGALDVGDSTGDPAARRIDKNGHSLERQSATLFSGLPPWLESFQALSAFWASGGAGLTRSAPFDPQVTG
jgi:hypothetical protein